MSTATENVPIPVSMKNFIEGQLPASGFHTATEYVCELIRLDQIQKAEAQLRDMILIGVNSGVSTPADQAFFDNIEAKIKARRVCA